MKNFKLARFLPVLALAAGTAGCEDLTALNENPNSPTDVPARFVFTEGLQDAADRWLGASYNFGYAEIIAQHLAQIQYAEEDLYLYRDADLDALFRDAYSGYLMDFHTVAVMGEAEGDPNVQAGGTIMRSWTMQNMTDLWGDLPYSDAFGGVAAGNVTPAYDTQEQIYDKMFADLAAASAMIDPSENPFGAQDLVYQGDMDNWRKFANSLRLRMALRVSDVASGKAATQAAAALAAAGGVITSADQNAQICYTSTTKNPWYDSWLARPGDYRISASLVNTMKSLNDPRLSAYAQPIEADSTYGGRALAPGEEYYEGFPNGLAENDWKFTEASQPGEALLAETACLPLMTLEEVLFLRAEAAARGLAGGDAGALYNQAITASMTRWGASSAEIAAYLAQPSVAWNAAQWRQRIGTQKWIALFGQGAEAFAEVRRLNYPVLTPGPDAELTSLPKRYPYPFSEETFNNDNLQTARSRQSISTAEQEQTARLWWDTL
jgi:hypothetical protein